MTTLLQKFPRMRMKNSLTIDGGQKLALVVMVLMLLVEQQKVVYAFGIRNPPSLCKSYGVNTRKSTHLVKNEANALEIRLLLVHGIPHFVK